MLEQCFPMLHELAKCWPFKMTTNKVQGVRQAPMSITDGYIIATLRMATVLTEARPLIAAMTWLAGIPSSVDSTVSSSRATSSQAIGSVGFAILKELKYYCQCLTQPGGPIKNNCDILLVNFTLNQLLFLAFNGI